MDLLHIFTFVITLAAIFAYVNQRFIRFPSTIGLMILALGLSLALQLVGLFSSSLLESAERLVRSIDFSGTLLDFMLSFLLFAGALHTDWGRLHQARGPIITFATIGVILSTFMVGSLMYSVFGLFNVDVPYLQCLLFGAVVSPTDPIAVLGILKRARVPESTEIKIVGESLFNDGIGVVTFMTLLHMARQGISETTPVDMAILLAEELVGGIGFGMALGFVGYRLLKSIDHYQTEVLLTIAMVIGGYLLANALHFSGPLAMVTSGIFIGNKGKEMAMSDATMDYTFKFWEMIDEIMNASLFVLIGLEILVIPFRVYFIWISLITIPVVLFVRYGALSLISISFGFKSEIEPSTISIMTWGGLRGGISIALALTIPAELGRNLILSLTYIIVLFSIIVQGLSLEPVIRRILKK